MKTKTYNNMPAPNRRDMKSDIINNCLHIHNPSDLALGLAVKEVLRNISLFAYYRGMYCDGMGIYVFTFVERRAAELLQKNLQDLVKKYGE